MCHNSFRFIAIERIRFNQSNNFRINKELLRDKMRPDPAFATSPICVPDKDYEFSVDPDIITFG